MNRTTDEPAADHSDRDVFFRFRLFVAGDEPNSKKARETLFRLAETYMRDRSEIVVVDILEDYQAGLRHHVVAIPTLIIEAPAPERVIVGSLSDEDKVLAILGLSHNGDRK